MMWHTFPGILALLQKHTPSKMERDRMAEEEFPHLAQWLPSNHLWNCRSEGNVGSYRKELLHAPKQRSDSTGGVVGARGNNLVEELQALFDSDAQRMDAIAQECSVFAEQALRNPEKHQILQLAEDRILEITNEGIARQQKEHEKAQQQDQEAKEVLSLPMCLSREAFELVITAKGDLETLVKKDGISVEMAGSWGQFGRPHGKKGDNTPVVRAKWAVKRMQYVPELLQDRDFKSAYKGWSSMSKGNLLQCLKGMMDKLSQHRGCAPIDWDASRADVLHYRVSVADLDRAA